MIPSRRSSASSASSASSLFLSSLMCVCLVFWRAKRNYRGFRRDSKHGSVRTFSVTLSGSGM